MSAKNNRICIICGKQYRYCSHGCGADLDKPAWMASFDTNNCRQICNLFTGNTIGKHISDEEAASQIKTLDTSNVENFNPKIKSWVKRMIAKSVAMKDEPAETQKEDVEEIKEKEKEISSDDINEDEPVG